MSDNKPAATILDLDALLDTEMGKVETLPDYVTPGPSKLALKVVEAGIKDGKKDKEGNGRRNIVIVYSITETLESDESPFPNGSLFSDRFQGTEEGLQYFKKQAMKILNVADMDGAKMRDILEALQNVEFQAAITNRKTKNDAGQEFVNVNVRPLHDSPAA